LLVEVLLAEVQLIEIVNSMSQIFDWIQHLMATISTPDEIFAILLQDLIC